MRNIYYMSAEPACRVRHPRDEKECTTAYEYYDRDEPKGARRLRTEIYEDGHEPRKMRGLRTIELKDWERMRDAA